MLLRRTAATNGTHDHPRGIRMGAGQLADGLLLDGLTDVYSEQHMGVCAETCADTHGFRYVLCSACSASNFY
jgi:acetyl-CoA acetyltransferase